jgi:hypothetical protein
MMSVVPANSVHQFDYRAVCRARHTPPQMLPCCEKLLTAVEANTTVAFAAGCCLSLWAIPAAFRGWDAAGISYPIFLVSNFTCGL